MLLEIASAHSSESQTFSAAERQLLAHTELAYATAQATINAAFADAGFPVTRIAPPLLVIPTEEITTLATGAANATEVNHEQNARQRRSELIKDGQATPSGIYLNQMGLVILPQKTVDFFLLGPAERAISTCAAEEEYTHHVTTHLNAAGETIGMGMNIYPEPIEYRPTELEPGRVYFGNLRFIESEGGLTLPELSGNPNVIIAENATHLLVTMLVSQMKEPLLQSHSVVAISEAKTDEPKGIIFKATSIIRRQLIKALETGSTRPLDMNITNAETKQADINLLEWLSKPNTRVRISKIGSIGDGWTGDKAIDFFGYGPSATLNMRGRKSP